MTREVVQMRVSDGEKQKWVVAAQRAGLTLSEWARKRLDQAAQAQEQAAVKSPVSEGRRMTVFLSWMQMQAAFKVFRGVDLPADARLAVAFHKVQNEFLFYVSSATFQPVAEGQPIPEMKPSPQPSRPNIDSRTEQLS
jgi:hypothetical protein